MNGYSKIRLISTTKSRSMDFSDVLSFPQYPKPITNTSPNPTSKTQETKQIKSTTTTTTTTTHDSFSEQEDEEGNGERCGEVLRRNCSHRFRFEKQSAAVESAVKRAFSMRRSSSVSERYCRIHDQSVTLASSPIDDDQGMDTMQTRSLKKKKDKRGKILKACKRLFGL